MSVSSILITIVVVVLLFMLLRYLFTDPYTLQGLQNGQTSATVSASSLASNGSGVPSTNFAYSIWFYVNDWNYRYGEKKVIFGRMGASSSSATGSSIPGINGVDPCPVVVLGDSQNDISVSLGCYPGVNDKPTTKTGHTVVHTCNVHNIPIQKWVNLVVSVYGRTMDIYIDGKLVRTCMLPGIASVNNDANVYITPSGGFAGWTSKFQYYPGSLNPQQVWNIYRQGYSNWLMSMSSYNIQLSLMENGQVQKSISI
jgi:hypothetical protein